jgi:hypothetical protein
MAVAYGVVSALADDFVFDLLCISFRNVHDPRALAVILTKAEEELASKLHPDPYTGVFQCVHHIINKDDAQLLFFSPLVARRNQMVRHTLSVR